MIPHTLKKHNSQTDGVMKPLDSKVPIPCNRTCICAVIPQSSIKASFQQSILSKQQLHIEGMIMQ